MAKEMTKIRFAIERRCGKYLLTADGAEIGSFGNEAAAADLAIRHAQECGALYTIFYQ